MFQQRPEPVPVPFYDVASYCSEEEWKLLHDWQKELYQNVMNEIHQALISLGPLIASTVFSLRAKEKEDFSPVGNRDSARRHSATHSPSDTDSSSNESYAINQEKKPYLLEPQDTGRSQHDCLSTGISFSAKDEAAIPIVSFVIKEEGDYEYMDHQDFDGIDRIGKPTGFNVHSTQSLGAEAREDGSNIISDNESMNRQWKVEDSVKCFGKTPRKALSVKDSTRAPQSSHKESNSRSQVWSEFYRELGGQKSTKCEKSFSNPVYFDLQQEDQNIKKLDEYKESESNVRNSKFPKDLPNTKQNQIQSTRTECDESFSVKGKLSRPTGTQSRRRPFACTECEKSFFQRSHLITHHRTHSGEKPYKCHFCHKSFIRKDYLNGHVRLHTGERPYTCTKCAKSFIRKCDLNQHQRKNDCSETATTAI